MPSGKQVLLHFLKNYSLAKQKIENLPEVSENIKVGFLLHGSTPNEMWHNVDAIEWGEESADDKNGVVTQGLQIKNKGILLSELFEYMIWNSEEEIPKEVSERFPKITQNEFYSATRIMSLILSSIEWSSSLSEIENNGEVDFEELEKKITSYKKKMKCFRKNPNKYLGNK